MLVTKSEFAKMSGYKDVSAVLHLIKRGTIIANEDGLIDLDNKKNKKWIKARQAKLAKDAEQITEQEQKTEKSENPINNQMHLEISALNKNLLEQKFIEQQSRAEFSRLRLSERKKELFERDVVTDYAREFLGACFKTILQLPSVYAHDVQNIFKTDKNPIESYIKFFTEKIDSEFQSAFEREKHIRKKHFKQ